METGRHVQMTEVIMIGRQFRFPTFNYLKLRSELSELDVEVVVFRFFSLSFATRSPALSRDEH